MSQCFYDNLEFFNVGELRQIDGREGLLMQRLPETVRQKLRPKAAEQYMKPGGVQIRFASESFPVKIRLFNYGKPDRASVYFGDFQSQEIMISEGENEISINMEELFLKAIPIVKDYTYAPTIVRIIFHGTSGEIHYCRRSGGTVRPPDKSELPSLRYLAYGTSITHGSSATSPLLTYAAQTAWRIHADLINLGTGASAFCEEALVDYMADRDDWDVASVCVSVNMLNQGVGLEEFYQKVKYLVTRLSEDASRPVFCISIFPYYMDLGINNSTLKPLSTPDEFRDTLKRIVDETGKPWVHYLDGREMLGSFCGLSSDLIHPGSLGMIRMGEFLAKKIQSALIK